MLFLKQNPLLPGNQSNEMKTISMEMNMRPQVANIAALGVAARESWRGSLEHTVLKSALPESLAYPARRAAPAWLPAPSYRRLTVNEVRPAKKARTIKAACQDFSHGERAMLGLLVLASVGGIGYGLSCLLDLVQNWAQFSLGVAHLLG